jgi:hypothetical protein
MPGPETVGNPSGGATASKLERIAGLIGFFVGAGAYALLPRGVFGTTDVMMRAVIVGAVTALTAIGLVMWARRGRAQK